MQIRLAAFVAVAFVGSTATAQDWALKKLEKSTRHQEFVKVKHGDREVNSFIVYPEVKDKATAVIVIHEIFGLSEWVRSLTDQLAAEGYIAIAPDLMSGMGPKGGGTEELKREGVMRAIRDLKQDQITADLNACAEYVGKLPAANGKLAVCGFCWGGGQTLRYASANPALKSAFVFYGTYGAKEEDVKKVACPVYGFYGENDNRINATIPTIEKLMKAAGKTYEPLIYNGAGHGFMRMGDDPEGSAGNKKGRDEAWTRWKDLLKKI